MISDYMEVDIKEENLLFSDVLENKNIWTSTIKYEDNNFLILIDNIDLFVILINKNEIVVLFKGEPFPPPWDVYPYDKRWIYSYFRFR
jgi:hypothetical protein